jgi:plasmid maintenance system antidote protein VapI
MTRLQIARLAEDSGAPRHRGLKVAMVAANVRSHRVAARLDISDGHLSHLLNGGRVATPEMLDRIEAAIAELSEPAEVAP